MAGVKKKQYEQKGITTSISATSRIAVKIRDNYYTVEAHEERSLPADCDVDREYEFLWDSVNSVVDTQAEELKNLLGK